MFAVSDLEERKQRSPTQVDTQRITRRPRTTAEAAEVTCDQPADTSHLECRLSYSIPVHQTRAGIQSPVTHGRGSKFGRQTQRECECYGRDGQA
jgi:hypothetical protein